MIDYKDMTDAEKVEYLEKRLAAANRALQMVSDAALDGTQKLAVAALKLEAAVEKAREVVK